MNKFLLTNILDYIKAHWLFFIPHHLFSRFTYLITRTKHPLKNFLIKLDYRIDLSPISANAIPRMQHSSDFNTHC